MSRGTRTITVEKKGEIKVYNQGAMQHNGAVIEYARTCTAVFSGFGAGVLGLTALYGFLFYIIALAGMWLLVIAKVGSDHQKYFTSRKAILLNGFFGAMFTYILCWTFAYGMVHIY